VRDYGGGSDRTSARGFEQPLTAVVTAVSPPAPGRRRFSRGAVLGAVGATVLVVISPDGTGTFYENGNQNSSLPLNLNPAPIHFTCPGTTLWLYPSNSSASSELARAIKGSSSFLRRSAARR